MQRGSKSSSNFTRQKSFSRPINPYANNASNNKYSSGDQQKDRHASSSSTHSHSAAHQQHSNHSNDTSGNRPGPAAGGSSNLRHASSPTNRRESFGHIPPGADPRNPSGSGGSELGDRRHGSLGSNHNSHSLEQHPPNVNMAGYSSGASGGASNTLNTNDQELREIHDKMSLKITQLTKVVFNLNTKNDEHNETLKKLKSTHKQELAAVAQDMESKLSKLKEKASNEIQIKNRIKELEEELNKLNSVKAGFDSKIDEIKSQAQQELDSRVTDHERKFNAVNKQVTEVIDKLNSANGKNELVKTEYTEKISNLEAKLETYQQAEDQLKLSTNKIEQLNLEIKNLQDKFLKEATSSDDEYKVQLQQLQATHIHEVEKLKCDNEDLQTKINDKLSKLEDLNKKHLIEVAKFNNLLAEKENELILAKENEEVTIQKLNDSFEKILIEKELNFHEQIKKLNSDLEVKLNSISEATGDLKSADATNEKLRENIEVRDMQLTEMNNQVKALVDANAFKDQQNQALNEKLAVLSLDIDSQKGEYESRIDQINQASEASRKALIENHKLVIKKLTDEHNSELGKLQEIYDSKKIEFDKQREKQLVEIERMLVERQADLGEKSRLHQVRCDELAEEIMVKELKIKKLQSKNAQLLQQAEDLKALNDYSDDSNKRQQLEVEILQKKLSDLENEIDSLDYEKEKQLKELNEKHVAEMDSYKLVMDGKYESMLQSELEKLRYQLDLKTSQEKIELENKLRNEFEGEAQRHAYDFEKELNLIKIEYRDYQEKKDKELANLSETYIKEKESLEQQQKELTLEIFNEQENHKIRMQQMELQQEDIISSLKSELSRTHNITFDKIKLERAEELRAQEEDLLKSKQIQLKALEAKLLKDKVSAITEANEQHEKRVAEIKAQLEGYQSKAFDQLQTRFKKELGEVTEQALTERELALERENELAKQIDNLRETLSDSKQMTTTLDNRISELGEELDKSKRINRTAEKDKENIRLELQKQQNEETEKLVHVHEMELTRQERDWKTTKQQMTREFTAIQNELNDRILNQDNNIKKWKDKWSQRGPRQEDKEKMGELADVIKQKDHTIDALVKDKRFYQEELANRDRNFTKIFTGNGNGLNNRVQSPLIGVYDPLSNQTVMQDRYGSNFKRMDLRSGSDHSSISSNNNPVPPRRLDPIANPHISSNAPIKKFIRS